VQRSGYVYLYHRMATGGQRRASVPETVGAWLKVWTPPRDVVVPPPPVRKLLMWGAAVLVVVGVLTAILAPRIDSSKDRRSAAEAKRSAAAREARRLETIREQKPRFGASELTPAADAPARQILAARERLLTVTQHAIAVDARERVAAGELEGASGPTTCEPYPKDSHPERDLGARQGIYDCLVQLRAIKSSQRNGGGLLGYPFRAVLDFRTYRYAFCKTNPVPGERMVPDPRTVVELPRACTAG
jgi:hypothetical protein